MSDQDVNTQETQGSEQNTTEQTTPSYEDLLTQITNDEGKPKYSSVEDALKGTQHAQSHIKTLEEENNQYKEENQRMKEYLEALQEQQAQTSDSTATTATSESPKPEESGPSEDEILEKLMARMSEKEKAQKAEANKREALGKVQELYADKAGDYITEKAAELGLSTNDLLNTAATSPVAFYKMVGLDSKKQAGSDWSSSVNTATFDDNGNQKREYTGKSPLLTGRTKDAADMWNSL